MSAQWRVDRSKAVPVARAARRFAGANPDLSTATAAVHRSAASLGATLTPGDIAIERAGDAAARLDAYLDSPRVAIAADVKQSVPALRVTLLPPNDIRPVREIGGHNRGSAGPTAKLRRYLRSQRPLLGHLGASQSSDPDISNVLLVPEQIDASEQLLVVGGPAFGPEPPPRCAVYGVGASSLVGTASGSAGDTAACSAGGCSATGSAGCGAACCSVTAGASGSAAGCSVPLLPSFAVIVTSFVGGEGFAASFYSTSAVRTLDGFNILDWRNDLCLSDTGRTCRAAAKISGRLNVYQHPSRLRPAKCRCGSGIRPSPADRSGQVRIQPLRYLHDCSDCFRLERLPGGNLHPLESAAFARRTPEAVVPGTCSSPKRSSATAHSH